VRQRRLVDAVCERQQLQLAVAGSIDDADPRDARRWHLCRHGYDAGQWQHARHW
jgi:hypothetical protein